MLLADTVDEPAARRCTRTAGCQSRLPTTDVTDKASVTTASRRWCLTVVTHLAPAVPCPPATSHVSSSIPTGLRDLAVLACSADLARWRYSTVLHWVRHSYMNSGPNLLKMWPIYSIQSLNYCAVIAAAVTTEWCSDASGTLHVRVQSKRKVIIGQWVSRPVGQWVVAHCHWPALLWSGRLASSSAVGWNLSGLEQFTSGTLEAFVLSAVAMLMERRRLRDVDDDDCLSDQTNLYCRHTGLM